MKVKRFQHTVAMSSITLPVAAVLSTLLWCAGGVFSVERLGGWLMSALMAYLWIETNNANSLIRVRTLLIAAVYVVLVGSTFSLHSFSAGGGIAFLMLLSYNLLFRSYGKTDAVMETFHAFLCIGVAGLFNVEMLFFVPVYFCYIAFFLRSLCWRSFCSAWMGVLLPYWFLWGYHFLSGEPSRFVEHFKDLSEYFHSGWSNGSADDMIYWVNLSLPCFFVLIAIIHYLRTSFNDKIRTRMYLYFIVTQQIVMTLLLLLFPMHKYLMLHLVVMNAAPLIAHYFTLAQSRLSNILFIVFLLSLLALVVFNIWMLSVIS